MIVPDAAQNKALFVIDVQPQTFKSETPISVTRDIVRYIHKTDYAAYVVAEYYAPPSSMLSRQHGHNLTKKDAGGTCDTVLSEVYSREHRFIHLRKTTRSCFKSSRKRELLAFLKEKAIEEIHFAGFDINDCVLASAYDAIDSGYYSFVLEELCHHNAGDENLKNAAISIFRRQHMSNNSLHEKIARKEV